MGYNNVVMSSPISGLLSTDQSITIDKVIQLLQELTPHWWSLGEAAGVQRTTLKEVSVFFFGGGGGGGGSSVCISAHLCLNSASF